MSKSIIVVFALLLSVTACKQEYPIDNLPPDVTSPNLTVPFVSTAAAYRFIPFGAGTNAGYEVYVADSATAGVIASSKGYVKSVQQNTEGDFKILLEPKRNSIYTIIYNHVKQVTLVAGDSVVPNTVLGKIGVGGRASLQVNRTQNNATVALCLDSLASQGFRNAFNLAIQKHNQFNPTDSVLAPCSSESIPQ